jgi:hypothetical protein
MDAEKTSVLLDASAAPLPVPEAVALLRALAKDSFAEIPLLLKVPLAWAKLELFRLLHPAQLQPFPAAEAVEIDVASELESPGPAAELTAVVFEAVAVPLPVATALALLRPLADVSVN